MHILHGAKLLKESRTLIVSVFLGNILTKQAAYGCGEDTQCTLKAEFETTVFMST